MLSYSLQGAWGKDIPDKKLSKALSDFGVKLDVEARKDGLSNIKIVIDDDKILEKTKKIESEKTKKTTELKNKAKTIKTTVKKTSSKK